MCFWAPSQHIRMVSEASSDTGDWKSSFAIVGINYNLNSIETVVLNCNNITHCYCFYSIFHQITEATMSFFQIHLKNLTNFKPHVKLLILLLFHISVSITVYNCIVYQSMQYKIFLKACQPKRTEIVWNMVIKN